MRIIVLRCRRIERKKPRMNTNGHELGTPTEFDKEPGIRGTAEVELTGIGGITGLF